MKLPLLSALFLFAASCAWAQTTPAPDSDADATPTTPAAAADGTNPIAPATGSTVVTSDELHMDENTHVAVFTGNVVTTGTNFSMKCQQMTVNFDKGGKVDTIVAKGDVVIVQPGRITHCGQAVYYHDEDKFDLTDQPMINDSGKTIAAPEIIIYRLRQSLLTKGPSKVTIPEGNAFNSTPATTDQK